MEPTCIRSWGGSGSLYGWHQLRGELGVMGGLSGGDDRCGSRWKLSTGMPLSGLRGRGLGGRDAKRLWGQGHVFALMSHKTLLRATRVGCPSCYKATVSGSGLLSKARSIFPKGFGCISQKVDKRSQEGSRKAQGGAEEAGLKAISFEETGKRRRRRHQRTWGVWARSPRK